MGKVVVINTQQEWQYIQKAQKNPKEFSVIYEMHYHTVFNFIYKKVNDENTTATIVSEVFYKAMLKLKTYIYKGLSIKYWLLRIAYNEVINYFRKESKVRHVSIEEEYLKELAEDAEEPSIYNIDEIIPLLDALKEEELFLIETRYFDRRSYREIGEILDITESNAKVKVHRVINKLRKMIKEQYK